MGRLDASPANPRMVTPPPSKKKKKEKKSFYRQESRMPRKACRGGRRQWDLRPAARFDPRCNRSVGLHESEICGLSLLGSVVVVCFGFRFRFVFGGTPAVL